jgi:hypothetical protein
MSTPLTPDIKEEIGIRLSDIIEINAPTNSKINGHIFVIKYLDSDNMTIIDENTLEELKLTINEEGQLNDESIESISIINRDERHGYARQHDLVPNKWIDVYFTGDVPLTITGEITNLEEDMIEIKTYPDNKLIYIDFGYKGLPKDIPIEKIIIREPPEKIKEISKEALEIDELHRDEDEEDQIDFDDRETLSIAVPEIKAKLKEIILDANQIQIGIELEEITQEVNVSEKEKRFSIEKQTNDLLDELLSHIPNAERTQSVLNNIHVMIERFTQLRTLYSKFDERGNPHLPKMLSSEHKPLVQSLQKLNKQLYWILPVAKNKKKVYDLDLELSENNPDIDPLTLAETRIGEDEIIDNYKNNSIPDQQNKYVYLYKSLNPYFTPYEDALLDDNLLETTTVNTNLTAVIDNLDDFYSSVAVNDDLKRRRFVIQKYNLGLSHLKTMEKHGGKMTNARVPLTNNDTISIKSFLTLPEVTIRFSKINLPTTNILNKSDLALNFLNYWEFLKQKTNVNVTIIDDINKSVEHNPNTFLKDIHEFIADESIDDEEKYKKYLEAIIPKTRILFNMVKEHIKGQLSLHNIIGFLEPFLIYQSDITFKQYEEITTFLREKIDEYKSNYMTKLQEYQNYKHFKYQREQWNYNGDNIAFTTSILYKLLEANKAVQEEIFHHYEIDIYDVFLSSSEIYQKLLTTDFAKLYMTTIAKLNIDLMVPIVYDSLEELSNSYDENIKNSKIGDDCKKYVLSKKYTSIEDMEKDEDHDEVYFDKQYDNTFYDIILEYEDERSQKSPEDFVEFLIKKLMENNGLSKEGAEYDAETMIKGKKIVKEGHYSLLELDESHETPGKYYYARENQKWEHDENVNIGFFDKQNKILCNLQESCFEINENCVNNDVAESEINKNNIVQMINEFDKDYNQEKSAVVKKLDQYYKYNLQNISQLIKLKHANILQYDKMKIKIGRNADDEEIILSPYSHLKDIILSQGDFVKKQSDIIQFANKFTRSSIEGENAYWLYCIKTDTKLLPLFFLKLATTFVNGENYLLKLEEICKEQGDISDDGEAWVDKHSGYIIKKIDFDNEEGYGESGFKLHSREIMERDLGDIVLQGSKIKSPSKEKKVLSPEMIVISNIISTLTNYMGIDLNSKKEFIIHNVLLVQQKTIPTKEEYERKVQILKQKQKEGKKGYPTYKNMYFESMIMLTLAFMLTSIQIMIPPVRTRKTFPNCVKSFSGFPLSGESDLSGLEYLICVAYRVKKGSSSIAPWDSIKKMPESVMKEKVKQMIQKFVISNAEIKEKFEEKKTWMNINENELIPVELDISRWINFLPPLVKIKNKAPTGISKEFQDALLKEMKSGSFSQWEKITVIQGKIVSFSIAIQEIIHKLVAKARPLLTNSNNEPFLENSCCTDIKTNPYAYFYSKDDNIHRYNVIVESFSDILEDLGGLSKAVILLDPKDTKLQYPLLSDKYSEETIYRAFIVFCKYNSHLPISEELRRICLEKPSDFIVTDSITEKIRRLKADGKHFSDEALEQLMDVINRENIVHIDLYTNHYNYIQILRDILTQSELLDNKYIPVAFRMKFSLLLDTFDISQKEDSKELRDFRNYLSGANENMMRDLLDFFKRNSKLNKKKFEELEKFIESIFDFHSDAGNSVFMTNSDESTYRSLQYLQNSLRNIAEVFPNIILNNVDYSNVKIPRHWKLLERHVLDVKGIIRRFYSSLVNFYDDKEITSIVNKVQNRIRDIYNMAINTPFISSIDENPSNPLSSIFNQRTIKMLSKYYLLLILTEYTSLSEDEEILFKHIPQEAEESKTMSSVEIEEENTGVINEIEIVQGEKKLLNEKIAKLLITFLNILMETKSKINYSYSMIMDKVLISKEHEKDKITSYIQKLTDEEREIENLFKNNKLERWSKGLQKGLIQYDKKTYDDERNELEKQALMNLQLGKSNLVSDMNQDIYQFDLEEQQIRDDIIEAEENDLSNLADDDDFGEGDGDDF